MNPLPNWFPHQVGFPFIERFGATTTLSRGAPTEVANLSQEPVSISNPPLSFSTAS